MPSFKSKTKQRTYQHFFGPLNLKRGDIFQIGIDIVEGLEYITRIAKDLILLLKALKSFVFITYSLKHLKTF